MATVLDHSFSTSKPIDQSWAAITDLERIVPCVEGGTVLQKISPESVRAEIKVKMGAMALVFTGTVDITEQNAGSHRAVMQVKAKEKGGQGHANATVEFNLNNGGGNIHTSAQITGKAASMGEGAIIGVLDALIKDFTGKLTNM
jgi:carbon monoxide dehydrogenase subunit G